MAIVWEGKEPIFLSPEQALQLASDRRVLDDLKFAAREVLGLVTREWVQVDGEKPIEEK